MQTIVRLLLLLVISTLVAGYKLPHNDPGNTIDDSNYPLDMETDIDDGSARLVDTAYDVDFPFNEENDPGSA